MKFTKILFSILLMSSMFIIGCGPKDPDIKASVEEKLKTNTDMSGPMTVSVNDGVGDSSNGGGLIDIIKSLAGGAQQQQQQNGGGLLDIIKGFAK